MKADFGQTAEDYRKFRAGFPFSFFQSLLERKLVDGSEEVVDLGTGTGTVARGLATIGCHVTGVDPSADLLNQAEEMAKSEGIEVNWQQATAEATCLADSSFDIAIAGQCWHWFDPASAIREILRILRNDSSLIIARFDWLPTPGNVVEKTESLIREMNPEWNMSGGTGIYPEWFRHLSEGGFQNIQSYSYDEDVLYTHEGWRGRIRASAGVGGSLTPEKIAEFDQNHAEILQREFPEQSLSIPHRVFVVHGKNGYHQDDQ